MGNDTTLITDRRGLPGERPRRPILSLVLLWSRAEPERIGEVAIPDLDDDARDDADADDTESDDFYFGRAPRAGARALVLVRQRPGANQRTGSPRSIGVSREQWKLRLAGDALEIDNIGRRALIHNGVATSLARVRTGDRVEIADELLFLAVRRPPVLPAMRLPPALVPCFGAADAFGIVGESAAAWELRRQLAFAAGREDHVLLSGPSGSGKELAARTIHGLSRRSANRIVARNAATLPESLIDAELFGNPRDYPNPGMPERPGLIGAADGSTLFLDEIGELSHSLQAHLLRVVESGEYSRLGEARSRQADVRVVAATNRDPLALKHDMLGRLRLRVALPGLEARREDVPLLARHMLRMMAANDPLVAERVFPDGDPTLEPCWSPGLVGALVTAPYATHVRELQTRLWEAIGRGDGPGLTSSLCTMATGSPSTTTSPGETDEITNVDTVDPQSVTADDIRATLAACDGSRDRTWRQLGLRSRHQLVRLMRRHGINGPAPASGGIAPASAAG